MFIHVDGTSNMELQRMGRQDMGLGLYDYVGLQTVESQSQIVNCLFAMITEDDDGLHRAYVKKNDFWYCFQDLTYKKLTTKLIIPDDEYCRNAFYWREWE